MRAFGGQYFIGRLARKVSQVVGFVCLCRVWISAQARDICGQVPALTLIQLVGKGRHVGAFNAQPQRVVDRVQAQAVEAPCVAQIGRWRGHAHASRAIASSGFAVTHRTMLGVQRRATRGVWRDDRRLADLVGHGQLGPQLPRFTGHGGAVFALLDGGLQRVHALRQFSPFRTLGQIGNQPFENGQKLQLLVILGFVDDFAIFNRRRVISTNVVNEVKCL